MHIIMRSIQKCCKETVVARHDRLYDWNSCTGQNEFKDA